MRNIKTLLKLLYLVIHNRDKDSKISATNGMCGVIVILGVRGVITDAEKKLLFDFLRENIPYGCKLFRVESGGYWWAKGDTAERLKWLDYCINCIGILF